MEQVGRQRKLLFLVFFHWQMPLGLIDRNDLKNVFYSLLAVFGMAATLLGQGGEAPVEITSEGLNEFRGGIATAEDNVVIRFREDVAYADRLVYNAETKTAILKGNVRIYTNGAVYRGDVIIFNFDTKELTSADFRLSQYPAFVAAEEAVTLGENHYRLTNSFFTTDNREDPAWRVRAGTIDIYPGNRVSLKNLSLYVGRIPVLWLPYFVQSLEDDAPGYDIAVGQDSRMGFFVLNSFNFVPAKDLRASLLFDARSQRGLAGGVDLKWDKNNSNKFEFLGYYANDTDYNNSNPNDNPISSINNVPYGEVGTQNRVRLAFRSRIDMSEDGNLYMNSNLDYWSDPYVTLDFFEEDYRRNVQPDNYANFVQRSDNFAFTFFGRARLNQSFEQVQRLPEARLDIRPQKIFDTPIEYLSRSSVVNFRRSFASDGVPPPVPQNYSAWRYDTFHEIRYPNQYFDWLNVSPFIGVRGTYWSDTNQNLNDFNNEGTKIKNARGRFLPNVGFESSFKLSKTWLNTRNEDWGIYGLRHVAEPFLAAQFIPVVVGTSGANVRGFDDRLVSDRLQPLTFPAYNSVDNLEQMGIIRHGIRNRIQTRRNGRNVNLMEWELAHEIDTQENWDVQPGSDSISTNVFSDLRVNPLPWLGFRSYASIPTTGDSYTEFNNEIRWQPVPAFEFAVGNRYLTNSPLFDDSNESYIRTFYRLNEHWQFSTYHQFDTRGTNGLNEQVYSVYRDLTAWQLGFSFADRKINEGTSEQSFFFSLTLKAFPETTLSTGVQ